MDGFDSNFAKTRFIKGYMWKNMTVAVFFESIPTNASISSSTDFSTCPLNISEPKLNFPFDNCFGKPIPFYLVFIYSFLIGIKGQLNSE